MKKKKGLWPSQMLQDFGIHHAPPPCPQVMEWDGVWPGDPGSCSLGEALRRRTELPSGGPGVSISFYAADFESTSTPCVFPEEFFLSVVAPLPKCSAA